MVDIIDIPRANQLTSEYNTIEQAIDNIDDGGKITSMVIGAPSPPINGESFYDVPAQVSTVYMNAPSIMYETIRGFLRQRQQEISDELAGLGVTGRTR